ncbi:hypothetical protein AB0H82_24295 [Streptomyces sp. NPDC050732]|uniref:hypothetical protein n=1 Tax=Streptomyces sp. NPDC050732 TaxID=3154632 RepID=UPI00341851D9
MSEQIPASPGADGSKPVPRDPPDQQADGGQDRWDLQDGKDRDQEQDQDQDRERDRERGAGGGAGEDVPDTDEAGTGRRGSSPAAEDPSASPVPEEPSG